MTPLCVENLVDGKLKPRVWDMASVVCVDIVGFTKMSGTMEADRLCVMLSMFYERLDALADVHSVYKVDIIGDAYVGLGMCAVDSVRFCLNARGMAKTLMWDYEDLSRGCVSLRCAVHTGRVVGLVLDTVCFKYTLVGDTIVMAKKLECAALPGQVHCSAETVAHLDIAEFRIVPDFADDMHAFVVSFVTDAIDDCCKPLVKVPLKAVKPPARVSNSVRVALKKNDISNNMIPIQMRLHNLVLKN